MAAPTDEGKHKYLLLIEENGTGREHVLPLKARNAGSALLMAQKTLLKAQETPINSPMRLYEDTKCLGRMQLSRGVWMLLPSGETDPE
ncbi:hypothetical protein [Altericroceibacterium xinjiangense]|uniref:hypothetical protein n=1 Tax=Altericroceibacterium xinjiangense TaxID=762261 RepID=UPI000F7D7CCF|nr:hypothetical protein [Altericroceibacterium xinjiangense]